MSREDDRVRDANLVQSGLNGDRQALQQLVNHYQRPIYNIAYRILNDSEASADVTQTTFLLALENLRSYNPRYKFFSWIYRIAINEALDQCKKRQQFEQNPSEDALQSWSVEPENETQEAEMSRAIQHMLLRLQEDYRTVIILRHFSDLSYEEIASVLDIPIKTVRSRLYSARQLLKSHLQKEGYFSA